MFCLNNFTHYYFLIFFLLSQYLKFLGLLIILFVCVFSLSILIHFMWWTIFIFFYIFLFFFFFEEVSCTLGCGSIFILRFWHCGCVVGYLWFYYPGTSSYINFLSWAFCNLQIGFFFFCNIHVWPRFGLLKFFNRT